VCVCVCVCVSVSVRVNLSVRVMQGVMSREPYHTDLSHNRGAITYGRLIVVPHLLSRTPITHRRNEFACTVCTMDTGNKPTEPTYD